MNTAIYRKVKRVIDGDTFEVFTPIKGINFVRLFRVNAPEKFQKGGIVATNRLRKLIEGKTIMIIPKSKSYIRIVGSFKEPENKKQILKK